MFPEFKSLRHTILSPKILKIFKHSEQQNSNIGMRYFELLTQASVLSSAITVVTSLFDTG
jgi:hypothetical protein